MKLRCAICGRPTEPAVMIGNEAIGPKCARRTGLMAVKVVKGGRVRFVRPPKAEQGPQTMDLFEEEKA